MKPGFIIIVFIAVILAWAVLQSSFSGIINRNRTTSTSQRNHSAQISRHHTPNVDTYGRTMSPFAESVTLRTTHAREEDPWDEYLEIRADRDNDAPVTITGWKLESIPYKRKVSIGTVSGIPIYPGQNVQNTAVTLAPGDTAYIVSGISPIRVSFRTNICTGYLGENKTFVPRLSRDCPDPENEDLERFGINSDPAPHSNDEACIRALKRIGKCTNPGKPDEDLSRDCREFIDELDYNFCAQLHVADKNFARDEWYVYIGSRFNDIWNDEDDTILLLDNADRVVDSVSY